MLLSENEQDVSEQGLFPRIPMGKCIIPNDLIRSSLFTVTNHNIKREYIKDRKLYAFGETRITYTGEELRQDDEDVWLQIIALFSHVKNHHVEFLPYTLLNKIDWPARTQYRDKLKDSINRMCATNITISSKNLKKGMSLSLVRKFQWQDDDGQRLKSWQIWLEPEVVKLFSNTSYSKILWDHRKKLNPLAKWLHSYYSSHAEPFPIKVATIHAACGSKMKAMKHFRAALRIALHELKDVDFLEDFYIALNDLVFVTRKKSKNLLNYLNHEQ